jgi:hypothetical protein
VRGDALALVDAGRVDLVAEDLPELGVVEPVALDADEDGLLGQRDASRVVVGEERHERRVDRDRPLRPPFAFRTRSSRRERSTSSHSRIGDDRRERVSFRRLLNEDADPAELLTPALGSAQIDVSRAHKADTSQSPRVHEIVILTVRAAWISDYELYAHLSWGVRDSG